jgi:hypothetical protein
MVPRQVPIPLRKQTERELQKMERNGIISRVEDPTEWCTPMVVTPKSNRKVRVCVDLTKLNQFVQRENYIPYQQSTRHLQTLLELGIFKIRRQLRILANQALGKIETSNNVHNTLGTVLFQRSSFRNKSFRV